ncbi:MAG: MFS transporter [Alphaproteobacteria bacterium]|nr:MFS transporter [Alphaproteobacteria bacterium]
MSRAAVTADEGAASTAIPTRAVIAVVIGNWLEFYDFIVYTFFAVMIGKAFFPSDDPFISLLLSSAVFWAGFLTRPIGAAVIGAYADRVGRKAAMTLTIGLMALGTGLVALTPGYAQIGWAAPIILIVARLIQGFSCGGEVGPATTYLLEAAPANQRAAFTAWQGISQQLAGIMGAGFGLALAATLSPESLYDWGWRVPFLVGILIGPIGLYIRRVLPETLEKHEAHESGVAVLKHLLRFHSTPVVLAVLCIVGPTVSTYVSSYMTSYAITSLKLPPDIGMFATLCGYAAGLAGFPLGAWAADRLGTKLSILVPRIFFVLIVYQAYVLMTASGSTVETLLVVNFGLNFILAVANGGLYALLTQAFPKSVRSSGLSIAYAISVTVFGGSTQFVITWLIAALGDPLVPAWYQIGANVISIIAVFF